MMGPILVFGDCGENTLKNVHEKILAPFQILQLKPNLEIHFKILFFIFVIDLYLHVIKDFNVGV